MGEFLSKPVKDMDISELESLCAEIRTRILEVVSTNGGHLSSTLGAVELIVAMHHVFDYTRYPFIFDVSHQAYAHKLLTGRYEQFASLRKFGGISGFCAPRESSADYFIAGHSSTSISLGVGAAKALRLQGRQEMPIVLIGDGSMSAGLVYEALNELGDRKYPMLIILNDNEMSIAKPIGAISKHLSQIISHPMYRSFRSFTKKWLEKMPDSATYLAKRFEESLKLITPGILFEEMGIEYIGPIDGHRLEDLIFCFKRAQDLERPVIVHAQTIKGKGYTIAEGPYEKWHGVGPFDLTTGQARKKPATAPTPTQVYATTLQALAAQDEKIVGITAAMPGGTGLGELIDAYPDRFWDAGIAEQHCVTSMAAMSKEGFIPFVSIYSTFLQRAFDQIVHDVGIMGLPVRFSIDRAGIVGEDGETHQGLFDIAYLRMIPGFVLFAPRDNASLTRAIEFAHGFSSAPCAYRYPRNSFVLDSGVYADSPFVLGELEILKQGREVALIGYGNGVGRAHGVCKELENLGLAPSLIDLRFVKPLPKQLESILRTHTIAFVFSDSYVSGGVGSAIMEFASELASGVDNELDSGLDSGLGALRDSSAGKSSGGESSGDLALDSSTPKSSVDSRLPRSHAAIYTLELGSSFIPHGDTASIERAYGLDTQGLMQRILPRLHAHGLIPESSSLESNALESTSAESSLLDSRSQES